ncbi:MAG: hypothetical protein RMM17_01870 [Acidobacteriota bacterium]|nr:hypothetical protein [Acidobacteriota bacterium]
MILRGYEVGVVEVRVVYGVGGMGLYVGLGVRGRDVEVEASEGFFLISGELRRGIVREVVGRVVGGGGGSSSSGIGSKVWGELMCRGGVGLEVRGLGGWREYDLEEIYRGVEEEYFGGRLVGMGVGVVRWGGVRELGRGVLGRYDALSREIVVNRVLDSKLVPRYVVEYIVYHEMLHVRHGVRVGIGGRVRYHTKEFREQERVFRRYEEAREWLEWGWGSGVCGGGR